MSLITELRDEADLCRNEQASDIAVLLDRAANEIEWLSVQNQSAQISMQAIEKELTASVPRLARLLKKIAGARGVNFSNDELCEPPTRDAARDSEAECANGGSQQ